MLCSQSCLLVFPPSHSSPLTIFITFTLKVLLPPEHRPYQVSVWTQVIHRCPGYSESRCSDRKACSLLPCLDVGQHCRGFPSLDKLALCAESINISKTLIIRCRVCPMKPRLYRHSFIYANNVPKAQFISQFGF